MIERINHKVSIPSDRGIRSGKIMVEYGTKDRKSQSPLIGAFVPGGSKQDVSEHIQDVSIPSDRGIRSG